MHCRLALESDLPVLLELSHMQQVETLPHLDYDAEVATQTFRAYMDTANPTFLVVEDEGVVTGFLMALFHAYAFCRGHFVGQEVIYVRPDKRGTRAAARLVKAYDEWADQTGPREIFAGVANGVTVERTVRFFEHFGFDLVGATLRRIPGHPNGQGRQRRR